MVISAKPVERNSGNSGLYVHSWKEDMPNTVQHALLIVLSLMTDYASQTEIQTELGSAVNFYLPPFYRCGRYNLTSPTDAYVVGVFNTSYAQIGEQYVHRSTKMILENGTVVLTVHFIKCTDAGTYLIRLEATDRNCWSTYAVSVKKDGQLPGHWEAWESWASCITSCGPGTRMRIRSCSTLFCCPGDSEEQGTCLDNPACPPIYQFTRTFQYSWTNWNEWSACSQSCGIGVKSRDRMCHDTRAIVENTRCAEEQREEISCEVSTCLVPHTPRTVTESLEKGQGQLFEGPASGQASKETVTLPLSVIVGTAAGIIVVILLVVIVVLVVKIRRKRNKPNKMLPPDPPAGEKRVTSITYRKKESIISQNITSTHIYDEIDDTDVRSDARMSVITVDNPYVHLPKSASPRGPGEATNHRHGNVQETVFIFDGGKQQGTYQNFNQVTEGAQSNGNNRNINTLEVPRHMSVDSTGYLMPGNTMERAERRRMKYIKK